MLTSMRFLTNLSLVITLNATVVLAQAPEMEHHHHHEDEKALGTVEFSTSCSPHAQEEMRHGVALLHSFGYASAQMQFDHIAKDDPSCAMAHWGVAMTQYKELWGRPSEEEMKLGREAMARARSAENAATTAREKAYIDALSTFFEPEKEDFQKRAEAYTAKMDALHAAYPEDVEAAAFDALALIASVAPEDTSLTRERKALAILVPLFAAHPDHPGLAHYIIHTCDTPALAADGLGAAREYAKIAPASAHALHMPSHIFARMGMWQEDIASNLASVAASEKAEAEHQPGSAHQMHAKEFLIYAYLQTGQDEKAHELAAAMRGVGDHMMAMPGMDDMKDSGHFFDNEVVAIDAMERHDWKALAALRPAPGSEGTQPVHIYWGWGVAAGHLHDKKLAKTALKQMDAMLKAMKNESYAHALRTIKRQELVAWKEYTEKHAEKAVEAMRMAADEQDKLGQEEVDIPAREMLGDLLMMENKPEEALKEYRVALKLSPNRLNGLLSAGAAAEKLKLTDEVRGFYRAAAQQTENGTHSQRPEVKHAVEVAGM